MSQHPTTTAVAVPPDLSGRLRHVPLAVLVEHARGLAARGRRQLLGISGCPGAGKSTTARAITDALGPGLAALVPMDGFHLTNADLERRRLRDREGAPETFDAAGYVDLLGRLRRGDEAVVVAPEFDRALDGPVPGAISVGAGVPLVITEGNYLLCRHGAWAAVADLLDEAWYLDLDDEVRRDRLAARHRAHGMGAATARAWACGPDEANARAVEASKVHADVVWALHP